MIALVALAISIPLWFIPPLVLIVPPLIWGWLTYRVMGFDVLAEHATAAERQAILRRHRVNVVNISVRHAIGDAGSLLAWARGETFAFVLYYKQRTRDNARNRVAVWTRELIDAALSVGGTYYLPYQPHATPEQFHLAYPRARELFALKRRLDPDYRLRNSLWDKYYRPTLPEASLARANDKGEIMSEFRGVFEDDRCEPNLLQRRSMIGDVFGNAQNVFGPAILVRQRNCSDA